MKKNLLLFASFLIAFSGFSQEKRATIGVLVSPAGFYHEKSQQVNWFYSSGLYYEHQFTRRSGISTGADLLFGKRVMIPGPCDECGDFTLHKVVRKFTVLEIPVNYTFRLNPNKEGGIKTFLFSGLTFTQLVSDKYFWYYFPDDLVTEKSKFRFENPYNTTFVNLGFEMRKIVTADYVLSLGTGARLVPAKGLVFSGPDANPVIFSLNLKFGRNL